MNKGFDTRLDEANKIVYLKTYRTLTEQDVNSLMELANTEYKDKDIHYCLIDMSQATSEPVSKAAREVFKKYADSLTYKRVAVVGATPSTRMLAKVALAVVGKSKVARFFKTEEDALHWFSEGKA